MATPLVVAHIMLYEPGIPKGGSWDEIPPIWSQYRFDTCDFLYISPFEISPTRHNFKHGHDVYVPSRDGLVFGCTEGSVKNRTGIYTKRFEWIIRQARSQNPNVKIMVMQFFGGPDFRVLNTEQLRVEYTDSVRDFLKEWQHKTYKPDSGPEIPLRVDGYDVDYEWTDKKVGNNWIREDANRQPYAPDILHMIREKVDKLSKTSRFYVTITPADTHNLGRSKHSKDLAQDLDFVNMQNYSGGKDCGPDQYLSDIPNLQASQLVWGIRAEYTADSELPDSLEDNIQKYLNGIGNGRFGGIMLWRLNSNNWVYENMLQLAVYNKVHSIISPAGLEDKVNQGWKSSGRNGAGENVSPFLPDDWIAAKQYRV